MQNTNTPRFKVLLFFTVIYSHLQYSTVLTFIDEYI